MSTEKYEPVMGLEVHAQMLTQSKAYADDLNEYGSNPNSNVSPVSLGHPGTLPKPNLKHFELAVRMGLACHCQINLNTHFARKNYFYADLPKGYQITQDTTPICTGGYVNILDADGNPKRIGITRIHMEEDSGKSIHDLDPFNTLIDLNRAGVPLIEIVTEPDFRHPVEAYNYLVEIRKIVRYLEICDGNMEEGSLRCDANVSIRPKGSDKLGTKVEVKNMNSISNVRKAIEFEIGRQAQMLEESKTIAGETRGFDATSGTTIAMRTKEEANDYRYFPEPDLPPYQFSEQWLEEQRQLMPPMPWELKAKYMAEYGLSEYDSAILSAEKYFALYFEDVLLHTKEYKAAANLMIGPIRSYLNENALDIRDFSLSPLKLAELIGMIPDKIAFSVAVQKLLPALLEKPESQPEKLAEELGLIQESDEDFLLSLVEAVVAENPDKAAAYRSGKKGLLGMFMGQIMKRSGGKADPRKTSALLTKVLEG